MGRLLHLRIRLALRQPRLYLAAVGMLSAGLAVGGTLYNLEDALLFRSLRVPNRERTVRVESTTLGSGPVSVSAVAVRSLNESSLEPFERWAGVRRGQCILTIGGDQRPYPCATVTPGFFELLGLPLSFLDGRGAAQVIVSDALAKQLQAAHGAVLGTTVLLKTFDAATFALVDTPLAVTGVAPRGFRIPGDTEVWRLPAETEIGMGYLELWGLIRGRRPPTAASLEPLRDRAGTRLANQTLVARPLTDALTPPEAWPVFVLLWTVLAVVLVGWLHVSLLFRARHYAASDETLAKVAIGATIGQLRTEVWIDACLVSIAAWALCIPCVAVATRYISSALPFTRHEFVPIGGPSLFATLTVAGLGAVVHGAIGSASSFAVSDSPLGYRNTARHSRTPTVLLALSLAVAVVLTYAATIVLASYVRTYRTDFGFDTRGLISIRIVPSPFHDWRKAAETAAQVLGADGDVYAVSRVIGSPFGSYQVTEDVELLSDQGQTVIRAKVRSAAPNYLSSLGVPLLMGQPSRSETGDAAILSLTAAAQLSPSGSALGRTIRIRERQYTVVAVCADFADERRAISHWQPQVYTNSDVTRSHFVARTRGDPEAALRRIVDEVRTKAPSISLSGLSYDKLRRDLAMNERAEAEFLVFVVAAAVFSCILSIYGATTELLRKHSTAATVRLALGGAVASVLFGIVKQLLAWLVAAGCVGTFAAIGVGHLVSAYVPNGEAFEPMGLVAAAGVAICATGIAGVGPMRRLRRTDVAALLRQGG